MIRATILIAIALTWVVASCKKKDESPTPAPATVTAAFAFAPKVGNADLTLDQWFVNHQQDSIKIRAWAFFISNIRLIDTISNSSWSEQDSYHLVLFSSSANGVGFSLKSPPKDFNVHKIQFSIGIDSAANSSTAYLGKGDLLLGNGMDWNWNDGWKFHLVEGQYRRPSTGQAGNFVYHIGFNQHYRTLTYRLPFSAQAKLDQGPFRWQFYVNPREIWGGSAPIDVVTVNDVMGRSAEATAIADNYATDNFLRLVSLQR